jgi:tetratricopeptide (TPR) repeat protein
MKPRIVILFVALMFGMIYFLQRELDKNRVQEVAEEILYLPSGDIIKRVAFGFDGMVADIYWLRTVQYFGRQLINENQEVDFSLEKKLRYTLLYPLLDITTTLDPQYIQPYRFGSLFLPDYNYQQAIQLLEKGIRNNPSNWRLYQNLGTVYWQQRNYQKASEVFFKGGEQVGAPSWMRVIGGVMVSQGGDRRTACQIYTTFYREAQQSGDELTRGQMEEQIRRIYALDEVDYLNELVQRYQAQAGKCPATLEQLGALLQVPANKTGACGQPIAIKFNEQQEIISPIYRKYRYDATTCQVKMPFDIYEPKVSP